MIVFNNQFPGPTLHANWGDFLEVTVKNSLANNGTSIHWHGIRQVNTNQMDGTNGLTECPIAPGESRTYRFRAVDHGTAWYHSHYSVQYGEGLIGPIVINGPTTADYDLDLGPFTMTDWFHKPITDIIAGPLQGPPVADNILVNGSGVFNGGGQYSVTTLWPGRKHKLRIMNTGINNFFNVALDGHEFLVVAADLVPIQPFRTSSLSLAIGRHIPNISCLIIQL